jgi:hypothetical protein
LYNVQKQLKCNVIQREFFTADLQNFSFLSLDESIGKIEVDPKEEASVVEVFQDAGNLYRNVFFVKSQCQSPFPLSLESWHLLKVNSLF